jgi:hypothetical protein
MAKLYIANPRKEWDKYSTWKPGTRNQEIRKVWNKAEALENKRDNRKWKK